MSRKIRKNKKLAVFVKKILPKRVVQFIVKIKGTGVLDVPRRVPPRNSNALACTIASNHYGFFCTPDSCKKDTPVQTIYRGEQYELQTIEYIQKMNLSGDIIHAGAYFGDTLPGLATCIQKNARIWAFEPNIESYRCAEITILLNKLENITLQNIGLGSEPGSLFLKTISAHSDTDMLGGKSRMVETEGVGTYQISIEKLDDVVPPEREVSLLHLDVEGFEENVLTGASKIIEKWSPAIIVEINNPDIHSALERLGYTLVQELDPREVHEGFRNGVFTRNAK